MGIYIFTVVYAAFWVGVGELARRYPETLSGFSMMSKERRAKYDMAKIGGFVAGWMRAAAVIVLLSMFLPAKLHAELLVVGPILMTFICAGYMHKYQDSRFNKQE